MYGPETFTFKEIIQKLLKSIHKKRILLPLPLSLANYQLKYYKYYQIPY